MTWLCAPREGPAVLGDGDIIAMVCTSGLVSMGVPMGIPEEFRGQGCPSMSEHPGEHVQLLAGVGIFTTAG